MGDLKIITNSKLRNLVIKGPNFCEAMSINWDRWKREIEIGSDSKHRTSSFSKPQSNNGRVCSSLLYNDFHEQAMELLNRMKAQGAQPFRCRKVLSKIIPRHEKAFANFGRNCYEILSELHISIRKLNVNN